MSRQARHDSKDIRRQSRILQKLEQQARPLTWGEMVVLQHLLRPILGRQYYSPSTYEYRCGPSPAMPFIPRSPQGHQSKLSMELARRAQQWGSQIPAMQMHLPR